MLSISRIFRTVLTPRRTSRDRPIGPRTLYRVYTMHNRRVGPTARRRADTLRLAAAPESPVGDVPTAVGAREHVIDYDERDTPCGEPRLTGRQVNGRMRLL